MINPKILENLKLKTVGVKHIDQYNELLRYVFQVTNQVLLDSGYEDGEIEKSKRPILQKAEVLGWFNEDKLVSQLCIYPCQVNIHDKIFKMGGLTGVGTYPEYANMGLMNELIKVGLEKMKENGQTISYLYPYSIPYYRRKGWEIMSDIITFTIKDTQLPKQAKMSGYIERLPIDHDDIINIYNKFAKTNHGALIRGKFEWDEYWRWENEEERVAAVYYNKDNEAIGFVLYWIAGDVFHIKEIIYLNMEAFKGLFNFISAHFSMVDEVKGEIYKNESIAFLLEDSKIEEIIEPYFMARIVDVENFLKEYPFLPINDSFHFSVTDSIAEWNQGIFGVNIKEDKVEISKNEELGFKAELDIRTLTAMLMGYRRPSYFYKIGRLKCGAKTLRILESCIIDSQPYFSDYF